MRMFSCVCRKTKAQQVFLGGSPDCMETEAENTCTRAHGQTCTLLPEESPPPHALRFNYALTGKQDRKQRERLPSRSRLLPPHMRPNVPKCERASPCDAGALHQSQILDTTSPSNRTRGGERHPLLGAAAIYQSVLRLCLFWWKLGQTSLRHQTEPARRPATNQHVFSLLLLLPPPPWR